MNQEPVSRGAGIPALQGREEVNEDALTDYNILTARPARDGKVSLAGAGPRLAVYLAEHGATLHRTGSPT